MGIVAVLTFTSTQVQAAGINAATPTTADTVQTSQDLQTTAVTGLVVPVSLPAALPTAANAKKVKKWNVINAPDLTTPEEHSDEPAARTITVPVSAYTSEPGQTDGSPFTTADGSQVRDGIVAANFLPIGTRIRIPQYFGDQVFEVHDRMNARYTYRMDIWMLSKSDAMKWGVRNVKIEVLN